MSSSRLQRIRDVAMVLCLAILICLPWTVRNAIQFHRFIPIRSDLPFELWMGNNPIYDPHSRQLNRITRYEESASVLPVGGSILPGRKRACREGVYPHTSRTCPATCGTARCCGFGWELRRPGRTFSGPIRISCGSSLFWNALTVLGRRRWARLSLLCSADGSCCPSPHIHWRFRSAIT